MPKPYTFPTLYDKVPQLCISNLKEWGFLNPGQTKRGTITWSMGGNKTCEVYIFCNTLGEHAYLELNYKHLNEFRKYEIGIISIPSNLGVGRVHYFRSPVTLKYCRKLYFIDGHFLHREAFKGCMYKSQTESKIYRQLDNILGCYFKSDQLYEQLYRKHFKTFYAGKPTKRYSSIKEKISCIEKIAPEDIDRVFSRIN